MALGVGLGVTVLVGGTIFLYNFVRETKQALSAPRDPWNTLDVDLH